MIWEKTKYLKSVITILKCFFIFFKIYSVWHPQGSYHNADACLAKWDLLISPTVDNITACGLAFNW